MHPFHGRFAACHFPFEDAGLSVIPGFFVPSAGQIPGGIAVLAKMLNRIDVGENQKGRRKVSQLRPTPWVADRGTPMRCHGRSCDRQCCMSGVFRGEYPKDDSYLAAGPRSGLS